MCEVRAYRTDTRTAEDKCISLYKQLNATNTAEFTRGQTPLALLIRDQHTHKHADTQQNSLLEILHGWGSWTLLWTWDNITWVIFERQVMMVDISLFCFLQDDMIWYYWWNVYCKKFESCCFCIQWDCGPCCSSVGHLFMTSDTLLCSLQENVANITITKRQMFLINKWKKSQQKKSQWPPVEQCCVFLAVESKTNLSCTN